MRYFYVAERERQREGRQIFACGICAGVCADACRIFFSGLSKWMFILDLFMCLLLLCGAVLVGWRGAKWPIVGATLSFVFRIVSLVYFSEGISSFFATTLFSVLGVGTVYFFLKRMKAYSDARTDEEERASFQKASSVYVRTQFSFLVGTFLSYVSPYLAFPVLLMLLWSLGIRLWVSYLLFRPLHYLSLSDFFEKKRPRTQENSS